MRYICNTIIDFYWSFKYSETIFSEFVFFHVIEMADFGNFGSENCERERAETSPRLT